MVKIVIIGWYGTETIGDRAILAGVVRILLAVFNDIEIKLGSILPFFTERTLIEDDDFLRSCSGYDKLSLSLFDSSKSKELDMAIHWSDYVVVGGGPLEDIPSMFMLEYALKKARKIQKKTLLIGCGIGPLYKKVYQKSMVHIVNHSDVAIFRDEVSKSEYMRLCGKKQDCISIIDPAVFALEYYKKKSSPIIEKNDQLVISVRAFTSEYKMNNKVQVDDINNRILKYIERIQQITDMDILFVPMHYFGIGDDDRYFMNRFRFLSRMDKMMIQNSPLTMEETMKLFMNAKLCIGMRFHSVVFQTILNGKNIIWDYTDPKVGKISAFISQIGGTDFYHSSYLNLQIDSNKDITIPTIPFSLFEGVIFGYENQYVSVLSKLKY
jgi:polysaccharide pyruvyl transferase WcaK-like protein